MEIKKNPNKNPIRHRGLFFNLGLLLGTLLVVTAFEWKSYSEVVKVDLTDNHWKDDEIVSITIQDPPPPPPKPKLPQVVEVPNDELIEVEMEKFVFDPGEIEVEPVPVYEPIPEEPVEKGPYIRVEKMPEPVGGYAAFYKYVKKNLKYPKVAKRTSIEGKVFVQFVVDEEGNITAVEVIKGIGGGCDEEASRVLSEAPKWSPGKQRGKPVKVRMVLPMVFNLN